jgi:hypothetical protein
MQSVRSPALAWLGGALAAGMLLLGAACGGSDDDSDSAGTTVETGAGDENRRLSDASWDEYVAARDRAQEVNAAATTTFAKCAKLAPGSDSEALDTCLGDSAASVVTEGESLLQTLGGFEDDVGGACADALTKLDGYVKLYVASVNGVETAVENDQAGVSAQIDEATEALEEARAARAPFEVACKPAV